MMPALPVADFVSCQAGLALGSLDAFLNAVLGFGDAANSAFSVSALAFDK